MNNIQPIKILRGVVCDTNDPKQSGRVKVYFPQLYSIKNPEIDKDALPWIEPLFNGYIKSKLQQSEFNKDLSLYQFYGVINVPRVGDNVLVLVFDNDYNSLQYIQYSYIYQDQLKTDRVCIPEREKIIENNFVGVLKIQSNDHILCLYDSEQNTKTQGLVFKTLKENYLQFLDQDNKDNIHIMNIKLNIQTMDIFGEYGNFLFKTSKSVLQFGKQTKDQPIETLFLSTGKVRWELEQTQTFRLQKFYIELEEDNDDNKVVRKKDLKNLIDQIHQKIHQEIQQGLPCVGCIFGAVQMKSLPLIEIPPCSNVTFTQ